MSTRPLQLGRRRSVWTRAAQVATLCHACHTWPGPLCSYQYYFLSALLGASSPEWPLLHIVLVPDTSTLGSCAGVSMPTRHVGRMRQLTCSPGSLVSMPAEAGATSAPLQSYSLGSSPAWWTSCKARFCENTLGLWCT